LRNEFHDALGGPQTQEDIHMETPTEERERLEEERVAAQRDEIRADFHKEAESHAFTMLLGRRFKNLEEHAQVVRNEVLAFLAKWGEHRPSIRKDIVAKVILSHKKTLPHLINDVVLSWEDIEPTPIYELPVSRFTSLSNWKRLPYEGFNAFKIKTRQYKVVPGSLRFTDPSLGVKQREVAKRRRKEVTTNLWRTGTIQSLEPSYVKQELDRSYTEVSLETLERFSVALEEHTSWLCANGLEAGGNQENPKRS